MIEEKSEGIRARINRKKEDDSLDKTCTGPIKRQSRAAVAGT